MTLAAIFDTELTDKENGEIIEAAYLEFDPLRDLAGESDSISLRPIYSTPWCERYRPSKPSTFGAMAVHHILPYELDSCPPSSRFEFPKHLHYIIGHSIDFDWEAAGRPEVKRICTHAMAQHVWPDADGYSQSALIYKLLGPTEETRDLLKGAHGAACDVKLNLIILKAILDLHPEITTWSQLWLFSEQCRIPRTCPFQKYRGVPLDQLDDGYIGWCLNQYWLDPYLRKGLEAVRDRRYRPSMREQDDDGGAWDDVF